AALLAPVTANRTRAPLTGAPAVVVTRAVTVYRPPVGSVADSGLSRTVVVGPVVVAVGIAGEGVAAPSWPVSACALGRFARVAHSGGAPATSGPVTARRARRRRPGLRAGRERKACFMDRGS